jgi:hypothetical protein
MIFVDCPAYLDERGLARCGLPAEIHDPLPGPVDRRAAGKRQNIVPTRTLLQRAYSVPYLGQEPGAAGQGTSGRLMSDVPIIGTRRRSFTDLP